MGRRMTDAELDIYMRGMCRGILYGMLIAIVIIVLSAVSKF